MLRNGQLNLLQKKAPTRCKDAKQDQAVHTNELMNI